MPPHVVIVGLGAMGAATAAELARRRVTVTGIDRFSPPHTHGSTHGDSRIHRQAYFEGAAYVPLAVAATTAWQALEKRTGAPLFAPTAALICGPPDSPAVVGTRRSAQVHDLPVEVLDPADVAAFAPWLNLHAGEIAVREVQAGVVRPADAVRALLGEAQAHGATLHLGLDVRGWEVNDRGVVVHAADGPVVGDALVVAAGPWTPELIDGVVPMTVERQVAATWAPPRTLDLDRAPVVYCHHTDDAGVYFVPERHTGLLKAALHHGGQTGARDELPDTVGPEDLDALGAVVASRVPALAGAAPVDARVCWYTVTPDGHFVIDRHPSSDRVVILAGFSGHGFKFTPVVGEVAADLATGRAPRFDLGLFAAHRPGP